MTTIHSNQGGNFIPEEVTQSGKPAELKSTGGPAPAEAEELVVTGLPTEDTMAPAVAQDQHIYLAAAASPSATLLSTQATTTPTQPVVPDPAAAQNFLQQKIAGPSYDQNDKNDYTEGFNDALDDANSNSFSNLTSLQQQCYAALQEYNEGQIDPFFRCILKLEAYEDAQQYIVPSTPDSKIIKADMWPS